MRTSLDRHFLEYIETLIANDELPTIPLTYSRHAKLRFMQRHSGIKDQPTELKITKDNLLVVQEGDIPEEVLVKVSIPVTDKNEELPNYYLGLVISIKEDKKGGIAGGTVITTFPYDRAQHLIKSLGRARRAEQRGKLSFRTSKKRRKNK